MNHSILLSQHSMTDAVVCASCPETYHDRVPELCLQHQVQKAFRKAGDTVNKRREKGWIPKWEAKVVMATVTKAQTLNTNKARILCIAGDKNCGAEMARQRVRAIKTGIFFSTRTDWGAWDALVCCMAKVFDAKELQIRWQVHLYGEASFFFSERSDARVVEWNPAGAPKWWSRLWLVYGGHWFGTFVAMASGCTFMAEPLPYAVMWCRCGRGSALCKSYL